MLVNFGKIKLDYDTIVSAHYYEYSGDSPGGRIYVKLRDEDDRFLTYEDSVLLKSEWNSFISAAGLRITREEPYGGFAIKKEIERGFGMESLKAYFVKHQDSIITLAVIVLLDHVLFGGALRDRIQGTVEKILGATEKKLAE